MELERVDTNIFCDDDFRDQIDIYRRTFHEQPRLVWRQTNLYTPAGVSILADILTKYHQSLVHRVGETQMGTIDLPKILRTPEEFLRFIGTKTFFLIFDYKEKEYSQKWNPRGFCTCDTTSRVDALIFNQLYLFYPIENSNILLNEILKLCFLEGILARRTPPYKRVFMTVPVPQDHNRTFYDLADKTTLDLHGIGLMRTLGNTLLTNVEASPALETLYITELNLRHLSMLDEASRQLIYQAEVFNHYDPKKLLGHIPIDRNALTKQVVPEQLFHTLANHYEHLVILKQGRSPKPLGVIHYLDYPTKPIQLKNLYIVPSVRNKSYGSWFLNEWMRTIVCRAHSLPYITAWAEGMNMRYVKEWLHRARFAPYRVRLHHEYVYKEYNY